MTKQQCPACGNHDNVAVLKEQSVLWDKEIKITLKNEYEVSMPIEEWERLKRLDENRKKEIIRWNAIGFHSPKNSEKALGIVKLLESLDK